MSVMCQDPPSDPQHLPAQFWLWTGAVFRDACEIELVAKARRKSPYLGQSAD